MRFRHLIWSILFVPNLIIGQIGGKYTFQFLNTPHSARTTALGSSQIATKDRDIILGLQSPSLLNPSMHRSLAINHSFHLADISFGNAAFGLHIDKWDLSTMMAINYISYGNFIRADEFANVNGEFSGGDIAFTLGVAKKWNERISTGINLKWAQSSLDVYNSSGLGLDVGVTYENPDKNTITTLVLRNIGAQFSSYDQSREAFPLDIQIGTSRRLKYLPLRISFILHNLNNWNLRSDGLDDTDPIFIDQPESESSAFGRSIDNFFHHMIINGEFLIGKNEVFRMRFGYNHQLKKELAVSAFRSLNGLSIGFGFKIKRIAFDYGFGSYHLAGGMNHISLSTNLSEWNKN